MKRPYIIAGPCSAESEAGVLECAKAVSQRGAQAFRAGLWKPRSRPGSFEGVGAEGLGWLVEARSLSGLPVCTEVACTAHVEACLKEGIDMLWIGARTTSSPFVVQEIADALRGVDIPVLVKNPLGADFGLWVGAFERLSGAGLRDLRAVHRGVSTSRDSRFRNDPAWDMAVRFRTTMGDVPIFCDPSHIAGTAALVPEIAQRAMDLGFDGLMVEVHPSPSEALSDAAQQLYPDEFKAMLDGLRLRESGSADEDVLRRLAELRSGIEEADDAILEALRRRMSLSREIGELKRAEGISIVQPGRWAEVRERILRLSGDKGLDTDTVAAIFDLIHSASVSSQK